MRRALDPPLHGNGVDLKRVPPKSRPTATAPGSILGLIPRWKRPARTPPSTFLFLPIHLSNSPGPQGSLSLRTSRNLPEPAGEPSKPPPPTTDRRLVTVISEELRRRVIAPSGGAPCGGYIGGGPEPCQPCLCRFCHPCEFVSGAIHARNRRWRRVSADTPRTGAKAAKCRTLAIIFTPL